MAKTRVTQDITGLDGVPTGSTRVVVVDDPAECVCNIVRPCDCAPGKQAAECWRGHRSVQT